MSSVRSASPPTTWSFDLSGGRVLRLGPVPRVMGVLNLTPDSFSDGGLWLEPARAVDHALEMIEAGADLLDLGAESSRPGGGVYGRGARTVPAAEEADRLLPVLEALRPLTEVPISVDTRKGAVARQTLEAGADLINDISALGDPELGRVVARAGCPVVLMHSRGELATMQVEVSFHDVTAEVATELRQAVERAASLGIPAERTLLDPGLGFGKTAAQNLRLLRELDRLTPNGRPLLVGASRKSFLGHVTGRQPAARLPGSLAAAAWAAHHRVALLRVHDVAETADFLAVWEAIEAAASTGEAVGS